MSIYIWIVVIAAVVNVCLTGALAACFVYGMRKQLRTMIPAKPKVKRAARASV